MDWLLYDRDLRLERVNEQWRNRIRTLKERTEIGIKANLKSTFLKFSTIAS